MPQNTNNKKVVPSASYKRHAKKAVIAIAVFILSYVILLGTCLWLVTLCYQAGMAIIAIYPSILTIIFGVGIMSLGLLLTTFLLKFIFARTKKDDSHLIQVTQEQEPRLFEIIEEIVNEVQTPFPKKVYLSGENNAAVFYNSSFWSMFFSGKKNLVIGMGLVSGVTISELKAILSHEFGHFSQKSLRIGSYVYNVNQVIFNLLYGNQTYGKIMQGIANIHGFIALFMVLAGKIIDGIQWILRKLYELVNTQHLALSREMEFNADEVAASVSGYEPLVSSLQRLSFADFVFNETITFYDLRVGDNIKPNNLFIDYEYALSHQARANGLKLQNHLPDVSTSQSFQFNPSKITLQETWSSHPSLEDRVERLKQTGFKQESVNNARATTLFTSLESWQKELTTVMFKHHAYGEDAIPLSQNQFEELYRKQIERNMLPLVYRGYYNFYDPTLPEPTELSDSTGSAPSFSELFSDDKLENLNNYLGLSNDLPTIKEISKKGVKIKTFDYDGRRYKKKQAIGLVKSLEKKLEEKTQKLKRQDFEISKFFLERASNQSHELQTLFAEYSKRQKHCLEQSESINDIAVSLQFTTEVHEFEDIRRFFKKLRPKEAQLRLLISDLLKDSLISQDITSDIRSNFEMYIKDEWTYFSVDRYMEHNLNMLNRAIGDAHWLLLRGVFLCKKDILDYQASLLEPNELLS